MAILLTLPVVALFAGKVNYRAVAFILALYALFLCYQHLFWENVSANGQYGRRASWPLMNPNTAGALMNGAFVACVGTALKTRHNLAAIGLSLIFCAGIWATGSKGAMISGALACSILFAVFYPRLLLFSVFTPLLFLAPVFEGALTTLSLRFPIWEMCLKVIAVNPWLGVGIGSFPFFAQRVTDGVWIGHYAHNDVLQIAVEMGVPAALAFIFLLLSVALGTRRENLVPALAFFAVCLHAMISFHFYHPAPVILMGLALNEWRIINANVDNINPAGARRYFSML